MPPYGSCGGTWGNGWYHFGEVAIYETGRNPTFEITLTVTTPAEFTPMDPAEATLPVNVFFETTIENLDDSETFFNSVLTEASSGNTAGDHIFTDGRWTTSLDDVAPGASTTFRDEWSLASLDDIVYELNVDGLSGKPICFTS